MERLVLWDIDRTLANFAGAGIDAFAEAMLTVTGVPLKHVPDFGGRTDRFLVGQVFDTHGVSFTDAMVEEFFIAFAAAADRHVERYRRRGLALPGAASALAALAAIPGVVQTVVTGNIAPVARLKLTVLDLAEHIDFDIAAYGSESAVRAELVALARQRATLKHSVTLADRHVIVIGDTVHDIEGALHSGAYAIGVATGRNTSADDLRAAGAHLVLESLAEVEQLAATMLDRL